MLYGFSLGSLRRRILCWLQHATLCSVHVAAKHLICSESNSPGFYLLKRTMMGHFALLASIKFGDSVGPGSSAALAWFCASTNLVV